MGTPPRLADESIRQGKGKLVANDTPSRALPSDSAMSFGLIRGGYLDLAVLGGLQVNGGGRSPIEWCRAGCCPTWAKPCISSPARGTVVATTHTMKGVPTIVRHCHLPLTLARAVSLIVIAMAVIEPTAEGLVPRERAPGVSVDAILQTTKAPLIVEGAVPKMPID